MTDELKVRESQIEDVLATYPELTQRIVGSPQELRLIARQMALPSGRIDLLFSAGARLLLIELKVEPFRKVFLQQITSYAADLAQLQQHGELVQAAIDMLLLCPRFAATEEQLCLGQGVRPVPYSPEEVLMEFYQRLGSIASFISLRPSDHGLWNIHLIHRVLYGLAANPTIVQLAGATGLSERSIANHLRFAQELQLVSHEGRKFTLTEAGEEYVAAREASMPPGHTSEQQTEVLKSLIIKDPFASPTIFGVYTLVEAVFSLSRNGYPVPWDSLTTFFREASGKRFEWAAAKTEYHGTRMYSNYAAELGLLGRVGHNLYLTPDGLRFILLLQLHKSIKMIDALQMK
ncbi:MAG: hypothetical protein WD379_01665 [Dehalococcoidia bacterium]